jgi:hypothetical protein
MDTDELIAATMRRVAASATPPQDAPTPTLTPTRRWSTPLVVAAAAAAVVLVVAIASTVGTRDAPTGPPAGTTSTSPSTAACRLDHPPKPLPTWARTGFTPPTQPVSYVLGDRGDMAAILWATHHPLVAPPAADRGNKILWVARVGATEGPLRIRATLASTGQTVTRTVRAAPGPSIIDLPAPGCWSLDLRWGSRSDHLVLGYADR